MLAGNLSGCQTPSDLQSQMDGCTGVQEHAAGRQTPLALQHHDLGERVCAAACFQGACGTVRPGTIRPLLK